VDTGLERRIELVDGIEGLYLKPISLADCKQRAGRAGRTKPGIYINCSDTPWDEREEYTKAEIERSRLDQLVLRLAEAGFDATELEFFHQPDHEMLVDAKRTLQALGAMSADGSVTKIGHMMAKLPIGVKTARMVIEADSLGVVDDVVTIAAILEQGEISARPKPEDMGIPRWKALVPGEYESDVMAQLELFKLARNMNKMDMVENGIFPKAYFKALEVRNHLLQSLKNRVRDLTSTGDRESIIRAVASGMVDHLYRNDDGIYRNGETGYRTLNKFSVVRTADWVVGLPWDLEIHEGQVLRLIRMATKVRPEWLAEIAPQLVERQEGINPYYNWERDSVVSTTQVYFNGQLMREEQVLDPYHPEAPRLFSQWLASKMLS
jgi:HrpA-like RNA helicase